MTTLGIVASWLLVCQLPLAISLKASLRTPSFAHTGFEPTRPGEDAHIARRSGRYQPERCRCRISAALVHHSWPLATFRMSMPIPDRKVRWGFLVLTGYALRPGHKERQ